MAKRSVSVEWAVAKAALVFVAGCASAPPPPAVNPARAAATRAADAIARGDGAALHAQLTPARQATLDPAACTRALSVVPTASRTVDVSGAPHVEVGFEGGPRFALSGSTYHLIDGVPQFDRRDTPVRAFETVARAIRAKDVALFARFVPKARRAEVTEARLRERLEDAQFIEETELALRALTGAVGERRGDGRWRVAAGHHEAVFEQEPDGWVLVDLW